MPLELPAAPRHERGSRLPWFRPAEGDGMAHADHRDVLLVAAEDPYAYLGTTDVRRPHVRPEREGGCAR